MKMFRKRVDYEAMTNEQLLEAAKRKGMIITPAINNRLMVFRAVTDDRQGAADRQDFINRLRAADGERTSRLSLLISIASLVIAVVSLGVSLILTGAN